MDLVTLPISEIFGPTVQGEGPTAGRLASFIRFGGCNLACSWCDTPYTWDASRYDLRAEIIRRPVEEIAISALRRCSRRVVLTGGEPLLQQRSRGWDRLLHLLSAAGAEVEVETNGTITPQWDWRIAQWNVSPKLATTGQPESRRINPEALKEFGQVAQLRPGRVALKIVADQPQQVTDAVVLADAHGFPRECVWISPQGRTRGEVVNATQAIADACIECNVNFSTRLHVLAWGDRRGV